MLTDTPCDNCGKTFQTGCFGSADGTTYYTPPIVGMPEGFESMSFQEQCNAVMMHFAKSAMTSLCDNCINQ